MKKIQYALSLRGYSYSRGNPELFFVLSFLAGHYYGGPGIQYIKMQVVGYES